MKMLDRTRTDRPRSADPLAAARADLARKLDKAVAANRAVDAALALVKRLESGAPAEAPTPRYLDPYLGTISLRDAAERAHRTPDCVKLWIIAGDVKGFKIRGRWRVDAADLRRLLSL
jgi:hypothetical protein